MAQNLWGANSVIRCVFDPTRQCGANLWWTPDQWAMHALRGRVPNGMVVEIDGRVLAAVDDYYHPWQGRFVPLVNDDDPAGD